MKNDDMKKIVNLSVRDAVEFICTFSVVYVLITISGINVKSPSFLSEKDAIDTIVGELLFIITACFNISFYVRYIKKALKSDNPKLLPVIVGPISFGIYFILVGVLL